MRQYLKIYISSFLLVLSSANAYGDILQKYVSDNYFSGIGYYTRTHGNITYDMGVSLGAIEFVVVDVEGYRVTCSLGGKAIGTYKALKKGDKVEIRGNIEEIHKDIKKVDLDSGCSISKL